MRFQSRLLRRFAKVAGSTNVVDLDHYDTEQTRELFQLHDDIVDNPMRIVDKSNPRSFERYYNFTVRGLESQMLPELMKLTKALPSGDQKKQILSYIQDFKDQLYRAKMFYSKGMEDSVTDKLETAFSYLHDAIEIYREATRQRPKVRSYKPQQQRLVPAMGA